VEIDSLKIIPAGIDDAEMISGLAKVCFSEAFSEHNSSEDMDAYLKKAFDKKIISDELKDSRVIFFILKGETENSVGYAKLSEKERHKSILENKAIQLERIYLRKKAIGTGAGQLLLNHTLNFAREKKFEVLWLAVWQENKRAIDFYKKHGFEICGVKKFVLGNTVNDDFVMKKVL